MKCQGPLQASAPSLAPSTLRQPQPCPSVCQIASVLPTILIGAQHLRTFPHTKPGKSAFVHEHTLLPARS